MANNLYGSNWTAARVGQLTELWGTALSAREIAATMGGFEHMPDNGRNAVLGKAHRMGLPPRIDNKVIEAKKAQQKIYRERQRQEAVVEHSPRVKKTAALAVVVPFLGSLGIPLMALRPRQCKFIAAEPPGPDYLACGNPTRDGSSYCADHHKLCRIPRGQRRPDKGATPKQSVRVWTFEAA